MKTFIKYSLFTLVILGIGYILLNRKLVIYGVGQLRGQMHIINNSVNIEDAIEDKLFDQEKTRKLQLIQEIKKFAIDSLGLEDNGNYSTVYDQKNKPVLWVVTASQPFFLEPFEWKFPYLGSVPYKGFFEQSKALEEEIKLRSSGYDTDISNVSAWSTLGFLHDPILSNMLNRGDGSLAELIIHEMTHATIFIKSDVTYNENLATFIGERGAVKFLEHKYGINSEKIIKYEQQLSDDDLIGSYMLLSANKLDSLYKALDDKKSVELKASIKYEFIAQIMMGMNRLPLNIPKRYKFDPRSDKLPNNTFFMSYLRYRERQDLMQEEYDKDFNGSLKLFIEKMKAKGS